MLIIFMIGIPTENLPGRNVMFRIVDSRARDGVKRRRNDSLSIRLGMARFYSGRNEYVFSFKVERTVLDPAKIEAEILGLGEALVQAEGRVGTLADWRLPPNTDCMQVNVPFEAAEEERPHCCPSCGVRYPTNKNELDAGCPVCLLRQAMQAEATMEDDLADEARFDHYELARRKDGAFEELGHGAMGVTYKAFDTVLHQPVALKVIDVRLAADPDVRQRFLREARAAARLRHRNVYSRFWFIFLTADVGGHW
jgi:predicted  nucleic acid-binding Zn-ribbon protein